MATQFHPVTAPAVTQNILLESENGEIRMTPESKLRTVLLSLAASMLLLSPVQAKELRDIYDEAKDAVVLIIARDSNGTPLSSGTGFYFRKRLLATNFHVVDGAADLLVKEIGTGRKFTTKTIRSYSRDLDVAIVETPHDGKPLIISNLSDVDVGAKVAVIGNPRGLTGTLSSGIVSGVRPVDNLKIYQITAPISPGSSGGPVLTDDGKVLGIATFTIQDSQNLNFAMPASLLTSLETKKMRWEPAKNLKPIYQKGNAGIEMVLFKKEGPEF